LKNRELLIGVTGGIAAFKNGRFGEPDRAGRRARLGRADEVGGRVLSGRPLSRPLAADLSPRTDSMPRWPLAASISNWPIGADILCIAPATANFLAKAANGLADDVLSTLYLCFSGPVIVAPAMNPDMWVHPAVVRNVERLVADGVCVLPPDDGWVACRRRGPGRMAAPERIFSELDLQLADR